jgi:hypothetical protein
VKEEEEIYCWCTQAGRGGDVLLVCSSEGGGDVLLVYSSEGGGGGDVLLVYSSWERRRFTAGVLK